MLIACCLPVKEDITDILNSCQLYSLVNGERNVLNMLVLQAVGYCVTVSHHSLQANMQDAYVRSTHCAK